MLRPLLEAAWTLLRANRRTVRWLVCLYESFYLTALNDQTPSYILSDGGADAGWAYSVHDFLEFATLDMKIYASERHPVCPAAARTPMYGDNSDMTLIVCAESSAMKFFVARMTRMFAGSSPFCSTAGDPFQCLTIEFAAYLMHEVMHLVGWEGHSPNIPACIANTFRWAMIQRYVTAGGCCDRFPYAINSDTQKADPAREDSDTVNNYTLFSASGCMWGTDPEDLGDDISDAQSAVMRANVGRVGVCCTPTTVEVSGTARDVWAASAAWGG